MKRAVIIGMGFAGLNAARALAGKGVDVLVIDRRNFHLFQPLLYQVATASIEQEYIAYPSRAVLRKWKGINFRLGEVTGIDFDNRIVRLADGEVSYDYLVLAAGSATNYFGMKSMEEHSFDLKSLDRTVRLRNHILNSFELAACEPDPAKRRALLSFVVVGGGPAGVEFAGSLQELIQYEIIKDYPNLDESETKIVLLEARGSILPFLPEKQRDYAVRKLTEMGVEVRLNVQVSGADAEKVLLANGTHIPAHTIVWTAGVQAAAIAAALELPKGAGDRIAVEPDLTIAGRPEVFVVGDIAFLPQNGVPLPMLAQVAMQGGEYTGKAILNKIQGLPVAPFKYFDRGNMVIIGRNAAAVNAFGVIRFNGYFAWVAWLALHLYYLAGFRNRTMVGISWILNYFFRSHQVRVISASTAKEENVPLKRPEVAAGTQAG